MNQPMGWTYEENKLFEVALAEIEPGSPAFFENVASKIPWKSIEDIKKHYEALIEDLKMIETGEIPIPDYKQADQQQDEGNKDERDSPSNEPKSRNGQQRRRGVPWTEEEHQLFLMGLNKYGKGDWRSISRYYVITKTPTQVASHAQKYFRRQTSSTPADRRRPSIHDIHTVNASMSQTKLDSLPEIPFIHNNTTFNSTAIVDDDQNRNPMFFPPHHNPFFDNQPSAAFTDFLPSLGNHQWG
ncbi:Duplicated homeodomain-like superfamily protein [Striga hermonthica]|uniref:Duplicated homeodomain-like superfamily protein n=1 Tax=Striga hermonthica TaxID=68872 RepID=A0A9N7N8D7_STRHE|nr:Duplicated homeodomain-like superfamily protein [Striga hermonthica]